MSNTKKFKAKDLKQLRQKSKKELLKQLDELKQELHALRVQQVSGGAPAKIANIRTVRKNIARIYTIISQLTRQKVREAYKEQGKKLLPLDLRPKLTRRERLRLPQNLRFKKTRKQKRLIAKYPQRKFAVLDLSYKLPLEVRSANLRYALNGKKPGNEMAKHLKRSQALRRRLRRDAKQRRDNQDSEETPEGAALS